MRKDEAIQRRKEIFEKRLRIRLKKAHDYAVDEDVHRNFKAMAELCRILDVDVKTPYGVCIFYILLKLDRACNLLFRRKEKPENETLEDTVAIDLANYVDLLDEILAECGFYGELGGESREKGKPKRA